MRKWASLIGRALVSWVACGSTVAVGRQLVSMEATLLIHALVAPISFGLLTWHYFKWHPGSSPAVTSVTMLAVVAGFDALVVAPFLEHSCGMFGSLLGTWVPFVSIFVTSYVVERASKLPAGRLRGSGDRCT